MTSPYDVAVAPPLVGFVTIAPADDRVGARSWPVHRATLSGAVLALPFVVTGTLLEQAPTASAPRVSAPSSRTSGRIGDIDHASRGRDRRPSYKPRGSVATSPSPTASW